MKPFDLKAALAGEPVVTRDGRKVVQIAHFPGFKEASRIVAHLTGWLSLYTFYDNGSHLGDTDSHNDLFMDAKPVTIWLNLYRSGIGKRVGTVYAYTTSDEADHEGHKTRIGDKAWPLTFEE